MTLAQAVMKDDRWSCLQQPVHPGSVEPRLAALLAALDLGWNIEGPVYLRPRWSGDGLRLYHFILRRGLGGQPRLVSVPECPDADRFVRDEGLSVIIWT